MPGIVAVHGIAQQSKGPETLRAEWSAPLIDGVGFAGKTPRTEDIAFAFYGHLFRGTATTRSASDHLRATDVQPGFEAELLHQWWRAAAAAEPDRLFPPDAVTRGTPGFVQAALRALSRSRFFSGLAASAMIGDLKQVSAYMHDPAIRMAARDSLDRVVTPECRVIVAHSLGSVVAYEALHHYYKKTNRAGITTLVTLGSP